MKYLFGDQGGCACHLRILMGVLRTFSVNAKVFLTHLALVFPALMETGHKRKRETRRLHNNRLFLRRLIGR